MTVICNYFYICFFDFQQLFMSANNNSTPSAILLQKKKHRRSLLERQDYLKVKWSLQKRIARTVWFARTGLWTGCSCHVDTRACVMAVVKYFSSAQCVGSSFRNLLHFAVKKSKIKTNWSLWGCYNNWKVHFPLKMQAAFLELIITSDLQY